MNCSTRSGPTAQHWCSVVGSAVGGKGGRRRGVCQSPVRAVCTALWSCGVLRCRWWGMGCGAAGGVAVASVWAAGMMCDLAAKESSVECWCHGRCLQACSGQPPALLCDHTLCSPGTSRRWCPGCLPAPLKDQADWSCLCIIKQVDHCDIAYAYIMSGTSILFNLERYTIGVDRLSWPCARAGRIRFLSPKQRHPNARSVTRRERWLSAHVSYHQWSMARVKLESARTQCVPSTWDYITFVDCKQLLSCGCRITLARFWRPIWK